MNSPTAEKNILSGKKIGVITPYDSNNYGAYLQAFSTKCILERHGADVAFLKFRGNEQRKKLFCRSLPTKRELLHPMRIRANKAFAQRKYEVFSKAWERFSTLDKVPFIQRDAFVLSSDEIWNVHHAVFQDNAVFFGYGLQGAISYAASVGKSTADDIKACPKSCKGMTSLARVLVRDEASADAVETITGARPEIVLDPTLLLDWGDCALPAELPAEPYVLVYAYSERDLPIQQICEFAKERGLKLVSVGFNLPFCDECLLPVPLEFYSLMREAEYVVTTTFHGSIFAMLSHSRFLTFPTSQKTGHLLKVFGMDGRAPEGTAFATAADFAAALVAPVDYGAFEARRCVLRDRSVSLLMEGLDDALAARRKRGHGGVDAVVRAGLCAGCGACRSSCAKGAISMEEGPDGALLPVIDDAKCVSCGTCDRACPVNSHVELAPPSACYAAWMEGDARDPRSTSGGVGHALACRCVAGGGTAFGAVTNGAAVRHVGITSLGEIWRLCGSKYVQSDIGDCYREIRSLLVSGQKVLFTGTPCQVAGLRSFLGKDWPNLTTADLVCHGTPPQRLLREHIESVVGDAGKVTYVSFRQKDKYLLTIGGEEGALYSAELQRDSYYHSFMGCLVFRDSCFACPYAKAERVGDLTIGDFWGLDRTTLSVPYQGNVSVVLVNSKKGDEALKGIDFIHLEERQLSEAVAGNSQLRRPSIAAKESKELKILLGRMSFDEAFRASGAYKKFLIIQVKRSKALAPLRAAKRLVRWRSK
ncbi:MAG: Coenzyme F420 hydrogenase/dehydrogenase, beta subunit C-terminal domain [Phoenicibacter congonensis]|uniref:Coenzyme F420 hydrogenase/dehydrogenase, beta subunit C-terminal domain n=1 Tax=Phoenicibacter congonensis TaxID=1944646 RepID=A0AA43RGK3_9ACTN|nr:Coenzyme F420 hydrogenase/dehydrogenase, beta subunit C-terminal domain [Phoenicibacter congonensis]